jgi:hypothetical protein
MKHIKLFESFFDGDEILLTKGYHKITIRTRYGKIEEILNESRIKFPFFTGQPVTVFMKGWACQHGFKWNGKDACDPGEKKVFGIKAKYIPKGHELRQIYPGKFRD